MFELDIAQFISDEDHNLDLTDGNPKIFEIPSPYSGSAL